MQPFSFSPQCSYSFSSSFHYPSNENVTCYLRYSEDLNDRIWSTDTSSGESAANGGSINGTINTYVPLEVLQTAATTESNLKFNISVEAGENEYMIRLYFLETNPLVKTGERVFDININGVKMRERFNISQNSSRYREEVLKVKANGSLVISLNKVSTDVLAPGPICNAYEVFKVHKRIPETVQEDGRFLVIICAESVSPV